ncbi:MAG: zinc ribbon domain-containing protein [Bdellovibrionales bacterium]|nr:zinc ribbon domain-containing protein [Bdellovibrionales bacterium]
MPIYEYECPKCGRFDAIQKVDEKPLKANPDCKFSDCPKSAKKLVSAPAFHLKGTGWYKTDYASSSSSASSSTGSSSGKAASVSSDSGSNDSASSSDTAESAKTKKKVSAE